MSLSSLSYSTLTVARSSAMNLARTVACSRPCHEYAGDEEDGEIFEDEEDAEIFEDEEDMKNSRRRKRMSTTTGNSLSLVPESHQPQSRVYLGSQKLVAVCCQLGQYRTASVGLRNARPLHNP